jgi:oligoendopeptidase F
LLFSVTVCILMLEKMLPRVILTMARPKTKRKPSGTPLPVWDLSDLLPTATPEVMLKRLRARVNAFACQYRGQVEKLTPPAFARAISAYEKLSEDMGRIYAYASLNRQTRLSDAAAGKLYQTVLERTTDMSAHILFFTLDINKMPDAALARHLKNKTVAWYRPWLDSLRAYRPHQLDDAVERVIHERDVTAGAAWVRLYDDLTARLRFDCRGRKMTDTEVFHLLQSPKRDVRRAAAKAIERTLSAQSDTFALILNTIAKEKEIDDRQRGFATVTAARNLDNQVEDDVVDALAGAVTGSYKRLSHRYYKLKAKWLGLSRMEYWDRNAPLPFAATRRISWGEARETVLSAYGAFHPQLEKTARLFFDNRWIDAAPRAGKDSGAFSASTVPSAHPYILMNYKGTMDDVMTLAHELGHGVHQVLAADQGYLMMDTPLTLAETASVFGEMLVFRHLLDHETDPVARRAMLAKKVEDMLNTVVRQIAFHEFERRFHTERKSGEVTASRIGDIWMEVMGKSLGSAIRPDNGYRHFWAAIPHFYHTPFYVYAYAFGDCLVNALYGAYQSSEKGFADRYINLLVAGGTKRHGELLAPFGLDAADPRFWARGLAVIEDLIDQLEYGENAAKVKKG